jgi:hypothetical protein
MGANIMVNKIYNSEILTKEEAQRKYRDFYIGMIITEYDDSYMKTGKCRGVVVYTADSYKEQKNIPHKTEDGRDIQVYSGVNVTDFPSGSMKLQTER